MTQHLGSEKRSFFRTLGWPCFSLQNRPLAVRNTRFEKQSSIYSSQMSKPNSIESHPEGKVAIRINLGRSGRFWAVLK
jgi:hypothetical protein